MPETPELDPNNIPKHVAIIMDGNGRWAQSRGLMRLMGHKAGVESVKKIVRAADELGISILTVYAFSTENWKRPPLEVKTLMGLLQSYLESELADLVKNNVSLRCIGEKEKLPDAPRQVLEKVIATTAENTGLILNLALSYGSRSEIIMAVKKLAEDCVSGRLQPDDITDDLFSQHLYTGGLHDPDLVIRTGGESRLSNFLLWQASYSEIYITETKWPDFDRLQLIEAIYNYQQRQRRFGKTGEQVK